MLNNTAQTGYTSGVRIMNGKVNGNIVMLPDSKQVLTLISKFVPYVRDGMFAIKAGIEPVIDANFLLCDNAKLNVHGEKKKGVWSYKINNKWYHREDAMHMLSTKLSSYIQKYRGNLDNITAKQLYTALRRQSIKQFDGGGYLYDTVHSGGSDERWSSSGVEVTFKASGEQVAIIYKNIDEGDDHNNTVVEQRLYPKEIDITGVRSFLGKFGISLNI